MRPLSATRPRVTDGPRGEVRPFRRADVAAVDALWRRCFAREPPPTPGRLEAVFLDNPWRQPDLPSLVYTDERGDTIGFLGVVPRPMSLDGASLRAATSTRLMVDPDRRGIAAFRLLQTFLAGPQDLSLADFASAGSRVLWERLGGATAIRYSLEWFRPVAPARAALGWLAHVARSRTIGVIAQSLGRLTDLPLTRLRSSPFRRPVAGCTGEVLSEAALLDCLERWAPGPALRPRYDPATLAWLLGMLRGKLRGLRGVRVRDADTVIGWYVYGLEREVAQVVRLEATAGRFGDVQRHLLADAFEQGAAAVCDRLAPRRLGELDDRLCILRRAPWVLFHSRVREVRAAIALDDAVLSRMDGEWWIPS
jgi:Acetyltransferase (GNAT) domain